MITNEGIIFASDSMEVEEGHIAKWKDYENLLTKTGKKENDPDLCFSPNDITEIFKPQTINNKKNAKKIFKITDYSIILVSGMAEINGKSIDEIIENIKVQILQDKATKYTDICEIVKSQFNTELIADNKTDKEKGSCCFILCFQESGQSIVYKLNYIIDESLGNSFNSISSLKGTNHLFFSGDSPITRCSNYFDTQFNKYLPNKIQAFMLIKNLMSLAIIIEEITHEIPRIGGNIKFGLLNDKGVYFFTDENHILNI